MLPSEFNRLIAAIRSLFEREIRQASEKQENTIRDAAQAANEEHRKIPGVIARVASAIEAANADVETYEKTQRKKEYGLQRWSLLPAWITAVATTAAFVAASIYACEANRQLIKMDETYREMRWQTYYSCRNAQIAQAAFAQLRIGASDTHTATAATIQQAAAGVESQRAYVLFDFRFPAGNEVFNDQLDIPYSLKNEGKSSTRDLAAWFTAILLRPDEPLKFTQKLERLTTPKFRLLAGEEIPGPPDLNHPQFHQPIPYIAVHDSKGEPITGTSQTTIDFLHATSSDMVFVYGHFQYSDFAGVHRVRFCNSVFAFRPGITHKVTAKEAACQSYNREEDSYSGMPKIAKTQTIIEEANPDFCKKPE